MTKFGLWVCLELIICWRDIGSVAERFDDTLSVSREVGGCTCIVWYGDVSFELRFQYLEVESEGSELQSHSQLLES